MSPKGFTILVSATAIAVALAAWSVVDRDVPDGAAPGAEQPVVAGLVDRLNDVATIATESSDGKLTLRRNDQQGWTIVDRGGYPADPGKVRDLALGVAGLRLVEAKTAAADRLPRLEVGEPGPNAKSRRVDLLDAQGAPLASLVVGKTRFGLYGGGRSGVYVRRAGEAQAWLAAGQLDVPTKAMDLVEREFLSVQPNQLARVILGAGGQSPVVMEKAASDEAFTLRTPPPAGRQTDPEKLERLGSSLIALTMQEVKPAAELQPAAGARTARFETWDGLIIEVRTIVDGEGEEARHWAYFTPSAGLPVGSALVPAESQPAPPAAAERAALLKAKLEPWAFELPSYLAERMTWTLDDLTAPPEGAS